MELKAKLAKCVDTVFDLMNSGDDARKAIVKTASAESLLPDQVTRLCQLYNRSASLSQKLSPGDLATKLAEAQIVDPREVQKELTERMMPKAAGFGQLSITQSLINRPAPSQAARKTAKAPEPTPAAKPQVDKFAGIHHGVSGVELVELRHDIKRKIAAYINEGEQLLSYARATRKSAAMAVRRLVSISRDPAVLKQAEFYLESHDAGAQGILAEIATTQLTSLESRKLAAAPAGPPTKYAAGIIGHGSLTAHVMRVAAAEKTVREELPKLASKIAALREEDYLIKTKIRGTQVVNRDIVLGDTTLLDRQLDHINKVASVFNSMVGSTLAKAFPGADAKGSQKVDNIDRYRLKLQNPQHEANLASIRARRSLQELLIDDPVISAQPENQVVAAYNEIAAFSPQVVERPAVLRAVLRQHLQNNASSFDLGSIKNLERTTNKKENK